MYYIEYLHGRSAATAPVKMIEPGSAPEAQQIGLKSNKLSPKDILKNWCLYRCTHDSLNRPLITSRYQPTYAVLNSYVISNNCVYRRFTKCLQA